MFNETGALNFDHQHETMPLVPYRLAVPSPPPSDAVREAVIEGVLSFCLPCKGIYTVGSSLASSPESTPQERSIGQDLASLGLLLGGLVVVDILSR